VYVSDMVDMWEVERKEINLKNNTSHRQKTSYLRIFIYV
jgi:hypothetical protein